MLICPIGARAVGNAGFGRGTGTVFFDDLLCNGDEDGLINCVQGNDCNHDEDAGVTCQTDGKKAAKNPSIPYPTWPVGLDKCFNSSSFQR